VQHWRRRRQTLLSPLSISLAASPAGEGKVVRGKTARVPLLPACDETSKQGRRSWEAGAQRRIESSRLCCVHGAYLIPLAAHTEYINAVFAARQDLPANKQKNEKDSEKGP
jgi:hypothetical protein